jgi:hypothetical protein
MANICRGLRRKNFFSPVLKSPTHIGFLDVKKTGSKISHLGTFKYLNVLHHLHPQAIVQGYLLAPKIPKSLHPFGCYSIWQFAILFRERIMLFHKSRMTSFHRLTWGRLGHHFGSFQPNTILFVSAHIKKLLDFWAIFFMQFVSHCLIF